MGYDSMTPRLQEHGKDFVAQQQHPAWPKRFAPAPLIPSLLFSSTVSRARAGSFYQGLRRTHASTVLLRAAHSSHRCTSSARPQTPEKIVYIGTEGSRRMLAPFPSVMKPGGTPPIPPVGFGKSLGEHGLQHAPACSLAALTQPARC